MAKLEYLQKLKTNNITVNVFLSNGTMLTGKIIDFDEDCIVLDECLLFKWQIISMKPFKPSKPVNGR